MSKAISKKPVIMSYTAELLRLIEINCMDSFKVAKSNYTATGVEAIIIDISDNQKYRLTIDSLHEYEGGEQRKMTHDEDIARRKMQIEVSKMNRQFRESDPNFDEPEVKE